MASLQTLYPPSFGGLFLPNILDFPKSGVDNLKPIWYSAKMGHALQRRIPAVIVLAVSTNLNAAVNPDELGPTEDAIRSWITRQLSESVKPFQGIPRCHLAWTETVAYRIDPAETVKLAEEIGEAPDHPRRDELIQLRNRQLQPNEVNNFELWIDDELSTRWKMRRVGPKHDISASNSYSDFVRDDDRVWFFEDGSATLLSVSNGTAQNALNLEQHFLQLMTEVRFRGVRSALTTKTPTTTDVTVGEGSSWVANLQWPTGRSSRLKGVLSAEGAVIVLQRESGTWRDTFSETSRLLPIGISVPSETLRTLSDGPGTLLSHFTAERISNSELNAVLADPVVQSISDDPGPWRVNRVMNMRVPDPEFTLYDESGRVSSAHREKGETSRGKSLDRGGWTILSVLMGAAIGTFILRRRARA